MTRTLRFAAVPAIALAIFIATQILDSRSASADFVCPVLPVSEQAKSHSNAGFITIAGGDTSILPGKAGDPANSPVNVPAHATNDHGNGSPGGPHAAPGQAGYTAIWNTP
jgi:hypothetical protein